MKQIFIPIIIFSVLPGIVSGQKISLRPAIGHGAAFSSNHGKDRSRIILLGAGYYHLNQTIQFGIEVNYSTDFIGFIGGNTQENKLDPNTGILYIDATNMDAAAVLGKIRYTLNTKKARPFFELGMGTINYFYNAHINDIQKVTQYNFSVQPEVGIQAGSFQFSLRYIVPGKTPSFDLLDMSNQQRTVLESISIQQLLLTVSISIPVIR